MQTFNNNRRLYIAVAAIIVSLILIIVIVGFLTRDTGKNQYGDRIRIQNYGNVVKNLSDDMRDSTETYLYNVVKLNHDGELSGNSVSDAYIRTDSSSQTYSSTTNTYDGNYIIDIESLKQSYFAQYSYSTDELNINTSSSPVIISCLSSDKLKYGAFDCVDLMSRESSNHSAFLQYLPFQNFSFKITPVVVSDKLELKVQLNISDIDLSGDITSKREVVKMYKNEVDNWITSKGFEPSEYTITYNYDDDGNLIDTSNNINNLRGD